MIVRSLRSRFDLSVASFPVGSAVSGLACFIGDRSVPPASARMNRMRVEPRSGRGSRCRDPQSVPRIVEVNAVPAAGSNVHHSSSSSRFSNRMVRISPPAFASVSASPSTKAPRSWRAFASADRFDVMCSGRRARCTGMEAARPPKRMRASGRRGDLNQSAGLPDPDGPHATTRTGESAGRHAS